MAVEIENVMAQRRASSNSAAAEIWIAYLHLMKAKGALKDQGLIRDLQGLMDAALNTFKKVQPARSP